ncbi:YkvA family protein [Pantoea sp.]|uniref:YkvA family protein n=1 Tax=Pantoea sp. TaxID=69393 RepID=UPI0028AC6413|nr:DUF1232 domain-containing protein [Pantoea sp.]
MLRQFIASVRTRARNSNRDAHAVWLPARDLRTAWFVKGLAMLVAACTVSPVDLIPDIIPVIGLPDNLVFAPSGIMLVVRFLPEAVMR